MEGHDPVVAGQVGQYRVGQRGGAAGEPGARTTEAFVAAQRVVQEGVDVARDVGRLLLAGGEPVGVHAQVAPTRPESRNMPCSRMCWPSCCTLSSVTMSTTEQRALRHGASLSCGGPLDPGLRVTPPK